MSETIVKGVCLKVEAKGGTQMKGARVSFPERPEYRSVGNCLEAGAGCQYCPANTRAIIVEHTDGLMSIFKGTDVEITFAPTSSR